MITHLPECKGQMDGPECNCISLWLDQIKRDGATFADTLRAANDAGVPHPIVLPQLVLIFRESFGEMPAGFALPGVG